MGALADVESVDVDLKAKTATVVMKTGKTISKDVIEKAFKDNKHPYGVTSFDKKSAKMPPPNTFVVGVGGMT